MGLSILYTIRDEKGEESTTTVNLPSSVTFSNVVLFAGEMAKLISPVITGAITRIGIAFTVTLPSGLRTNPLSNSDVEEGGRFQFRTENGFHTGLRLPTFNEAMITAGSRVIDQSAPEVAAFIAAMQSGIDLSGVGGSGTVQPSDKRGEDIVAVEFAHEQFQSSRG